MSLPPNLPNQPNTNQPIPSWPNPVQPLNYSQPLPPPVPGKPNIGMQAAKASWMAPLVGIALNLFTNMQQQSSTSGTSASGVAMVVGFTSFAIYILGLIFGIFALTRIPKFGTKGILVPAIVGVVIDGILVVVFSLLIIMLLSRK
jgi:hypothetical protein